MAEYPMNEETTEQSTLYRYDPWPGLYAYRENDHVFFHGRRNEIENLQRLLMRGRLSVLFGLSGLGKTSLLQAGLFPELRRKNILPVYIRLDFSSDKPDLVMQVKQAITIEASASRVEVPEGKDGETLWEYFHTKNADFWNERNRLMRPLLVLDQFEEIFTLGFSDSSRSDSCDNFLVELGNLIEGRPPQILKSYLDAHPENTGLYNFGRHHYGILLSLREDSLPELEGLSKLIPSINLNRMRLHRMTGTAGFRVVSHAKDIITAEVAEKVVRFVAGKQDPDSELEKLEVDPALLSVVCRELNHKRQKLNQPYITADLLEGSQEEILSAFYERSVKDLRPEVHSFIEENLLTDLGNRDSIALENALNLPLVDKQAINLMVKRRLLRIEERAGLKRLELTHDLLTGIIKENRDRRRKVEEGQDREQQLKRLREKFEEERQRSEDERLRAEEQAQLRKEADIEKLNALIERKKAEIERINAIANKNRADEAREEALRSKRHAHIGFAAATVVMLIAIGAFCWVFNSKKEKNIANTRANNMVNIATAHRLALKASEHLQNSMKMKNSREGFLTARLAFHFARQTEDKEAVKQSAKVLAKAVAQFDRTKHKKAVAQFDCTKPKELLHNPDPVANQKLTYNTIALSSDGKLMAAFGTNAIDILERNPDGFIKKVNSLALVDTSEVKSLSFSHDDELLASVMANKTIILWKIRECENPMWKIHQHTSDINSVAFDRDGKWLAFCSTDKSVQLWNLKTGRFDKFPSKLKHSPSILRFHPDKDILAFGCQDGTVYIWNIGNDEIKLFNTTKINTPVKALVFSTDSKIEFLAASHQNKANTKIVFWSIDNPSKFFVLKSKTDLVFPLAIKNNILFSGIYGWSLKYLPENGWWKQELKMQHTGDMLPMDKIIFSASSADGSVMAALIEGGNSLVWHTRRLIQADGICSEVTDFTEEEIENNNLNTFDKRVLYKFSCRKVMSKRPEDEMAQEIFFRAQDILFSEGRGSKKAIGLFDEAKKLDPKLEPEIEAELANWHEGKVKAAIDLAHMGQIRNAVKAFRNIEEIDKGKISAAGWNELCVNGIQFEKYKEVRTACYNSVRLEEKHGGYKGNRGILIAVTAQKKSELDPAIQDLIEFKEWVPETIIKTRIDGWIKKLNEIKGERPGESRLTKGEKNEIQVMLSPPKK